MADYVKTSKTLSYWLRHRPDAAGLMLDDGGWAEVDAVLTALVREGLDGEWEKLVEVVEQSDKQRFELSADAARIRARQGHSIAVEGDWRQADPPCQSALEVDPVSASNIDPLLNIRNGLSR